jgi:putative cardiolipin synthase
LIGQADAQASSSKPETNKNNHNLMSPTPVATLTRGNLLLLLVLLLISGCASLPKNIDQHESFALRDTDTTRLGQDLREGISAHPGQSGFHLLPNGLDAFTTRAMLASRAERSIDAQYYLLHSDLVGILFIDALVKAADRGVRVRLLVDDMTLDDRKDINAAALDAHPNIEIRVFNPFGRKTVRWFQLLSRFGEVTRRMHNKSFTVDNQVTVVGGRNIGDEYFEADPDLVFGDLDVLAVGPVVDRISDTFDLYWNSPASYPIATLVKGNSEPEDLDNARQILFEFARQNQDSEYLEALRQSSMVTLIKNWSFDFDWGDARVLYDHPAKISAERDQTLLHLVTELKPYTDRVSSELIIFTPYFVPGKKGVETFRKMRERGVRVRVLTNSLGSTDVIAVHAGYSKYRKSLLRAGVELYEIDKRLTRAQRREKKGLSGSSKASWHAKSFVIDRERVFIGSLNLDPRSVVENTEVGIMIESADIALDMSDWFDQIVNKSAFRLALEKNVNGTDKLVWHREIGGEKRVFTTEPNTGFWRRFGVGILRLLPIESQL